MLNNGSDPEDDWVSRVGSTPGPSRREWEEVFSGALLSPDQKETKHAKNVRRTNHDKSQAEFERKDRIARLHKILDGVIAIQFYDETKQKEGTQEALPTKLFLYAPGNENPEYKKSDTHKAALKNVFRKRTFPEIPTVHEKSTQPAYNHSFLSISLPGALDTLESACMEAEFALPVLHIREADKVKLFTALARYRKSEDRIAFFQSEFSSKFADGKRYDAEELSPARQREQKKALGPLLEQFHQELEQPTPFWKDAFILKTSTGSVLCIGKNNNENQLKAMLEIPGEKLNKAQPANISIDNDHFSLFALTDRQRDMVRAHFVPMYNEEIDQFMKCLRQVRQEREVASLLAQEEAKKMLSATPMQQIQARVGQTGYTKPSAGPRSVLYAMSGMNDADSWRPRVQLTPEKLFEGAFVAKLNGARKKGEIEEYKGYCLCIPRASLKTQVAYEVLAHYSGIVPGKEEYHVLNFKGNAETGEYTAIAIGRENIEQMKRFDVPVVSEKTCFFREAERLLRREQSRGRL